MLIDNFRENVYTIFDFLQTGGKELISKLLLKTQTKGVSAQ